MFSRYYVLLFRDKRPNLEAFKQTGGIY